MQWAPAMPWDLGCKYWGLKCSTSPSTQLTSTALENELDRCKKFETLYLFRYLLVLNSENSAGFSSIQAICFNWKLYSLHFNL
jgi:hypothetical protein